MLVSRSSTPENNVFAFDADLVPERENLKASTSAIDFDQLLSSPLLLHEDLKDGCGGQLWPAGILLSRYMLQYHRDLTRETIVEIGAGGGLVGLAVAKGCTLSTSHKLIVTDQIPMLDLMQKNIALNRLEDRVEAAVYDWGTPVPRAVLSSSGSLEHDFPTVVLAADCVYFEPTFPLLLQTLTDLIGPNTICYFCFKKRRKADMRFIREMVKKFNTKLLEYEGKDIEHRENIFLYQVTRKING